MRFAVNINAQNCGELVLGSMLTHFLKKGMKKGTGTNGINLSVF
jgi:hypothetical protein